ncbi:MAG TPA: hypothetical protein VN253_13615 [Kofleriaceae bacterium]|nr:hypothetical protein [Kofleriaceae bacterium]
MTVTTAASPLVALALALVPLVPGIAAADSSATAQIELNQAGADLAAELGLDVAGFQQRLAERVQEALGVAAVGAFLRSFSNATSFSNRGLGVDYASNSERGILGIGANLALAADLDGELPSAGAAANATVMAGLNLRRWSHPELTVFGNAFYRSASSDHLRGSIATAGAHLQYKLVTPTRGRERVVIQWGGLDVTTGVEVAHWSYGLRGDLSTAFEVGGDAGSGSTSIEAATAGHVALSATTVTVPIELTTNVRLLYLASLYLGLGLDAQVGASSLDLGVAGSLTGTRPDTGAVETIGAITVTGTGSKGPTFAGYHALLGLQANLWRLKLFAQATLQPIEKASLALGVRVVL